MARSTYYYLVNKEEVDVVAIRNEPVLKEIKIISVSALIFSFSVFIN